MGDKCNCYRFSPRDSLSGAVAQIADYLSKHPGWNETELRAFVDGLISATGVESFNDRTGTVTLDKNDVNNLKIASAYFAEGGESIDSLDLVSLYNQGVRFVFTDFNSATSGYNLAFALEYFSGSGNVVYYPMSTGSGGSGNIVSVNGKTGVVELSLADIIGNSGVQVKICTTEEFTETTTTTWNAYYNEGYRIVGVINSSATAIDHIYLLKQDENNHTPIGLSTGASDAYTPSNPPPYPVTSVNGKTGAVSGLYDNDNQPPYPVTSVNGKTGAITGLYDGNNQPPYPVTSVNGKTGNVTGLYDDNNPPPYPVRKVNGLTGNVNGFNDISSFPIYPGSIMRDILSRLDVTLNGSLPAGNTFVIHFRQSVEYAAIGAIFFSNRSDIGVSATKVKANDIYVYVTNMNQDGLAVQLSDLYNSLGIIDFWGPDFSLEYVNE